MFCSYLRPFRGGLKVAQGPGPHLVEVSAQAGYSLGIELIEAARSGAAIEDETRVFEYFEVLRDGGAADGQGSRELVDRKGSGRKLLEDGHARRVAESIETGLKVCVHKVERRSVSEN
jgi:hypothetical protein